MKELEYSSLETFFNTRGITNKEEYLITRVKKSFHGYRTAYRTHSKRIWINNLAEFYNKKGYLVSGHDCTIIEKILDVTGIRYEYVLRWLDPKYKQRLDKLDSCRDEIIQDYNKIKNLGIIAEKYNTTRDSISLFLKDHGVEVIQNPRHRLTMEKITPIESFSFLGSGTLYMMKAGYCDYLYKEPLSMDCTLIEEKEKLSCYNCDTAITQLIIGEKLIQEKTDYIVIRKVILCHKISTDHKIEEKLKRIVPDIKKYLEIEIIDLSSL